MVTGQQHAVRTGVVADRAPRGDRRSGPPGGPYDAEDLDPEATEAVGLVDFGAVRVPVPTGGTVQVERKDGHLQAVHIALPEGRLSVSALAAPTSSTVWPELVKEIAESLRSGGARVRSYTGDWGRELHATTDASTSVFVGSDGPRWMLYGVATGPTRDAVALDDQLRRVLRGTVVVRGRSPYPVRTVLPLEVPEHLADADPGADAAPGSPAASGARPGDAAAATVTAAAVRPADAAPIRPADPSPPPGATRSVEPDDGPPVEPIGAEDTASTEPLPLVPRDVVALPRTGSWPGAPAGGSHRSGRGHAPDEIGAAAGDPEPTGLSVAPWPSGGLHRRPESVPPVRPDAVLPLEPPTGRHGHLHGPDDDGEPQPGRRRAPEPVTDIRPGRRRAPSPATPSATAGESRTGRRRAPELDPELWEDSRDGRHADTGEPAPDLRSDRRHVPEPDAVELRSGRRRAPEPDAVELRSGRRRAPDPDALELRSGRRRAPDPEVGERPGRRRAPDPVAPLAGHGGGRRRAPEPVVGPRAGGRRRAPDPSALAFRDPPTEPIAVPVEVLPSGVVPQSVRAGRHAAGPGRPAAAGAGGRHHRPTD